jgi:monofunctional biosynthetic peptidoglycan transglycosylase
MADPHEPEEPHTPPPPDSEPDEPSAAAEPPMPDHAPEPEPVIERPRLAPPAPLSPPLPQPPSYVIVPHRRRRGVVWRLIAWLLIIVLAGPPAWVLVYRFVPPPITPLMVIRLTEGQGLDYRWRSLKEMSPALVQAAIAAEDSGFCQHNGFDFRAMEKAMANNQRRPGRIRGGSTISQQTAKNVFLWPDRSYVRKGLEAYFTVLIELLWGKRRIMEVYLNVIEMGPGAYGAEAAARRYFETTSAHLSSLEASRLAAILPSPLKWRAVGPGRYVQRRSQRIGGAMGTVRVAGLAACVGKLSGSVPSGPIDLNAAPPKGAEAFVQQQAAQEDAPASPADVPPEDAVLPASDSAETLDGSSAPASDADQTAAPASDAAPTQQ